MTQNYKLQSFAIITHVPITQILNKKTMAYKCHKFTVTSSCSLVKFVKTNTTIKEELKNYCIMSYQSSCTVIPVPQDTYVKVT